MKNINLNGELKAAEETFDAAITKVFDVTKVNTQVADEKEIVSLFKKPIEELESAETIKRMRENSSGVELESNGRLRCWITCGTCDIIVHDITLNDWLYYDPTCPKCHHMVMGLHNSYNPLLPVNKAEELLNKAKSLGKLEEFKEILNNVKDKNNIHYIGD